MIVSFLMRTSLIAAACFLALPACGQDRDPLAPLPGVEGDAAAIPATPEGEIAWPAYRDHLERRALAEGVSRATIDRHLSGLRIDDEVVTLDRRQYSSPGTWEEYRSTHVTRSRVRAGQRKYAQHRAYLDWLADRSGVPAGIVLAIYGKESAYGNFLGNYDILRSVATLAWEGRRRDLFERETIATLQLLDRGYTRDQLKGSQAGGVGGPQFLPSNIISLGVDGDGDGIVDLRSSERDIFASIVNHLVEKGGWEKGTAWGVAARTPPGFDRADVGPGEVPEVCYKVFQRHSRWKTVGEWKALGVIPANNRLDDDVRATLLEPDDANSTFFLTTPSYRALLDYNCSNFYSLAVAQLGEAIEG